MARPPGNAPGREPARPRAAGTAAAGGMGRRRVLVHSSGFTMSPYADIKPAGEDTKSVARVAPPQALALLPGQLRWLSAGSRALRTPSGTRVGAMSADGRRTRGQSSLQRRSAARTAVVWDALRDVLDDAGYARPAGRRGRHRRRHRRLRGPGRRARPPGHGRRPQPRRPGHARPSRRRERGRRPGHRPPGRPGHACPTWSRTAAPTWCSATASWRSSTTRRPRWRALAAVLRPGGTLSLLVNQRHAAVVARAMAGHFAAGPGAARRARRPAAPGGRHRPPVHRRRDHRGCSTRPGSTPRHDARRPGVRRPGAQLAGRPRARCRRRPWSSSSGRSPTRPEYLTLATQIHTLATRR